MINERFAGIALVAGGVAYFITNGILTPMLPSGVPWTDVFASKTFLARLSFASVAVFLLLVGSLGLYRRQAAAAGAFGAFAYSVLFAGSVFVFAHEWGQVFFLHELAIVAPEGLEALENQAAYNLYDIEMFFGLIGFMLGWILFAASMLRAKVFRPVGPVLILVGLFAAPVLGAALPDFWGFVVGNVILAGGWIVLGRELFARRA